MKVDAVFHHYLTTSTFTSRSVAGEEQKAEVARLDDKNHLPAQQAGPREVEQAVKEINDYMQLVRRNLEFSVDKDTQHVVVKVIDVESGEVVRQIPPDFILALAKSLRERENKGLLFVQRV